MASTMPEIATDAPPYLRIYKDGRVERLMGTDNVPPSLDPKTNVEFKDVLYSPENTTFSPTYHDYLNTIAAEAKVIAILVDYRRAPEHPVSIAYDDSWTALTWIASHSEGT
ncbi:hypothetical protein CRYUN_Cryun04dG0053300 [Craigia yunnanensis]